MNARIAGIIVLCLSPATPPLVAQDTTVIADQPTCAACSITVKRLARLGSLADSTGPDDYIWLARASDGSYYVSPTVTSSSVLIYKPDGSFAGELGRSGQGPGEFRVAGAIAIGKGDSLYVFDRIDRSRSVFTPEGGFVRRTRTDVRVDGAVELADGSMVIQGQSLTPDGIGLPAHVLTPLGERTLSFGDETPAVVPSATSSTELWRYLGPSGAQAVWLALPNRYVVERWSTAGQHHLTLLRNPEWFVGWDPGNRGSPFDDNPTSMIVGVWEDYAGLLWTVSMVGSRTADHDGLPAPSGNAAVPVGLRSKLYDAVVEVIDWKSGALVASTRIPNIYVQRTDGHGLLAARIADDSGLVFVDVYEVALSGWRDH